MNATAIRHEAFEHRDETLPGEGEFWILARCPACGWRVAVPGEGMIFPVCPKCHDTAQEDMVLPQRGVGDFGDSLGALALILPEQDALDASRRHAKIEIVG